MTLCDNFYILMILEKDNFVVASFPIIHADIVEVKFQWEQIHEDDSTEIHVFDRFARNSADLDHPLTGIARVEFSYDCAFMIEVSTMI